MAARDWTTLKTLLFAVGFFGGWIVVGVILGMLLK